MAGPFHAKHSLAAGLPDPPEGGSRAADQAPRQPRTAGARQSRLLRRNHSMTPLSETSPRERARAGAPIRCMMFGSPKAISDALIKATS